MSNRLYSDNELERLLSITPDSENNLEEDLMIDQGDGTKGCFNWELRGKGYHLVSEDENYINDIMEVPMGQIKKAGPTTDQYTSNLKPCFGIGFYNEKTKESYMLHYPDLLFYDIKKDIDMIKKEFGQDKTLVAATGASLDSSESKEYNSCILEDRNYIEKVLRNNFSSEDIIIKWSKENSTTSLYLDKNLGRFFIEKDK